MQPFWEDHCNKVANKIARNTGMMNRLKKTIPTPSMRILYNSFIFPHLSYGVEAWGSTVQKNLKRIKNIQKKSIRCISRSHWLAHTEPRMKKFKLLKFNDQYQFQCLTLTYSMLKGYSPDVYDLKINQNASAQHSLRSSTNRPTDLRPSPIGVPCNGLSFYTNALNLWNTLPTDVQNLSNRNLFKRNLKSRFLSQYVDHVNCLNPKCTDHHYHN